MSLFFYIYIACWAAACFIAVVLFLRDKGSYAIFHSSYRQFLFIRWKLITFVVAALGLTVIAPYTGDPTWDYVDALFMSLLTFLTAPWAVGVLYKTFKKNLPVKQAYVAFCVWMFSASWSYDLYILIRDGVYPITWFSNIFASSALYISAGLLWSLDWKEGRGVFFAFMEENWPAASNQSFFMKILWVALPFMILAAALIIPFIWSTVF